MSIVKKFNEWVNETYGPVKNITNDVYQAIVDAGLGDNFMRPQYNTESPWLTAQADTYGFDIDAEVDCIPFAENSIFDSKDYTFYQIFISDNVPVNDMGGTASLWIEYGENGYADGPEPWVFYYSIEADHWDGDGPFDGNSDDVNPELLKLISAITCAVNPRTIFTPERFGL